MKLTRERMIVKALLALCLGFILASCPSPSSGEMTLTGTVSITGTAQVGQTLTADTFALNGSGSIIYRWLRDDVVINNATGSSYTLVEADQGAFIKVEVKRNGYNGVIISNPKGPVAGKNDSPLTGTVSIDGIAQVGQTLTVNTSALSGDGSLSYLWYRDDIQINGAVESSYTLTESDRGKFIKVEVSRNGYVGTIFSTSKGPITGINETPINIIYAKEYWGEWIRMDTGALYYFNNDTLTINGQNSVLSPRVFTIESERVITGTDNGIKFWLYASRPATASFSGRIVDMRQSPSRAASTGNMNLIVRNIKNDANSKSVETDNDGKFQVPGSIAGDEYLATFPEAPEIPAIRIIPGYSGDDIGTVTLIEGVNFKISVRAENPQTTDITQLYADSTPYKIVIDIENIGTENCTGANFQLDFGDLNFSPTSYDRVLGTIVPGAKKSLSFTVNCPNYIEEPAYKDKVIGITIRDVRNKVWEDSVQLQFHKAPVIFNFKSDKQVQGVVITPRQKAYHFVSNAASKYSATITLPWSDEPYLVVFSGAALENETRYSMGLNVTPDTNFIEFWDTSMHEPNDTEETAYKIDTRIEPKIMSFLHLNDIDYFKVDLDPNALPVYITLDTTDGDYTISGDSNGDSAANPGETFNLNLKVKNIGIKNASGVTASLTKHNNANSNYLTLNDTYKSLGTLTAGGVSVNAAFSMSISSLCPAGTDIPLQVEFTNSEGNKWVTNFDLHIYPPGPTNVKAEALSETSIRISWNQAAGAAGYKVYDVNVSEIVTINGIYNTQYEHTGLNAGTDYGYYVTAIAENKEESIISEAVLARTWEHLLLNKQYGGTVSANAPHYYRFNVTNGVSYLFTSNVSASVKYETGNATWFNLSNGTVNQVPYQTGWVIIKIETVGPYTLKVRHPDAALSAFSTAGINGVINEAEKTITVNNVPLSANITSLTPVVTTAPEWTCKTTGAMNFTNPVEYAFTKGDAIQIYTVTIRPNGEGGITINPPSINDINIEGFPTSPFTLSRNGNGGYHTSMSVTLTGSDASSIEWWIGDANKTSSATNGGRTFTVQAPSLTIGEHTLTVIIYKNGIPYSNKIDFTVVL